MFSGPFTGDAADYYANPFRKQDTINQANLDAILEQVAQGDQTQQMIERMAMEGSLGPPSAATMSFLESETPGARDARMQQVANLFTPAFLGGQPFNLNTLLGIPQGRSVFSGLFGIPSTNTATGGWAESMSGDTGLGGLAGVDTSFNDGQEGISVI